MSHTPGPWIYSKHGFNVLTADARQSICAVHAIHPGHVSSQKDIEEHNANARLIAAAPELLETLKELLGAEWMVSNDWGGDRETVLSKAEAVIAKAENGV